MSDRDALVQWAPWPAELEQAVAELHHEPGWRFRLEVLNRDFADTERTVAIAGGLTFVILVPCNDSYHPENYRPVQHYHPVPAATFNRQSWERWLFDRLMDTIRHEAAEWFRFAHSDPIFDCTCDASIRLSDVHAPECGVNGRERRPFAPTHGPGDDPYVLHEYATAEQRRTSFRGEVNP